MIKLLYRYRRGVSPVIAVVLLIALTVAAAAVIWAITQGLIGGVSASLTTRDVDGALGAGGQADNDLIVNGIFVASDAVTIQSISLTDNEGETETITIGSDPITIDGTADTFEVPQGESTFSFTFNEDGGSFASGGYEVTIEYAAASGGNTQIYQFSVSA